MLHAATDLMRYRAVVGDDGLPITDLFFSPDLSTLTYIAVRKGAAPWAEHGVVSTRHFGVPDATCREIRLGAPDRALEDAPVVEPSTVIETIAQQIVGPDSPEGTAGGSRIEAIFERASDWIGAPVRQNDDVIGQVDDFLIDWPRPRVAQVVVNTGVDLPSRQVVLPVECCDVDDDDGRAVRISVDRDRLEQAPEIETLDVLDRHWVDTVRAYYKLPI